MEHDHKGTELKACLHWQRRLMLIFISGHHVALDKKSMNMPVRVVEGFQPSMYTGVSDMDSKVKDKLWSLQAR